MTIANIKTGNEVSEVDEVFRQGFKEKPEFHYFDNIYSHFEIPLSVINDEGIVVYTNCSNNLTKNSQVGENYIAKNFIDDIEGKVKFTSLFNALKEKGNTFEWDYTIINTSYSEVLKVKYSKLEIPNLGSYVLSIAHKVDKLSKDTYVDVSTQNEGITVRAIHEYVGSAIALLDKNNQVLFSNDLFEKFFNLTLLRSRNISKEVQFDYNGYFEKEFVLLSKYENKNGFANLLHSELNYRQDVYEFKLKTPVNNINFIEVKIQYVYDQDKVNKLMVVNDVTTSHILHYKDYENKRFKQIMADMPIMIHSLNEKEEIVEVSNFWLEILGYTYEEVIGRPSYSFMNEESREFALKEIIPTFFEGKSANSAAYTFVSKDGREVDVMMTWVILEDEFGNKRSLSISSDITSTKQLYKQVQRNEKILENIFDNSPLGIELLDLQGNKLKVNKKIIDLSEKFGYELVRDAANNELMASMDITEVVMQSLVTGYSKAEAKYVDFKPFSKYSGKVPDDDLVGVFDFHFIPLKDSEGQIYNLMCFVDDKTNEIKSRKQSEFQAKLLRNVNDVIISLDDNYNINYWNKPAEKVYGFSQEEVLGHKLEEFYTYKWIDDKDKEMSIAKVAEQGHWEGEVRHILKNKTELIVHTNATVIYDESGKFSGIIAVNRDITERKKYERELELNNRLMKVVGKVAKIGAWEFDYQTYGVHWTDAIYEINNLEGRDNPISISMYSGVFIGKSKEAFGNAIKGLLEDKKAFNLVLRFKDFKNIEKWVRVTGSPIVEDGKIVKIYGIMQDVTESYEKELTLRKNENFIYSLHANIDGVVYRTTAKNTVVYVNQNGLNLFDYDSIEELNQVGVSNIYNDPEERARVLEMLRSTGGFTKMEVQFRRKDGTIFWGLNSCILHFDENGEEVFDGIILDITEQKRKEQELNDLNTYLEQRVNERTQDLKHTQESLIASLQKEREFLDIRAKFITTVTHEYRTPLTIIQTATYLLEKSFEKRNKDRFYKQIEKITNSVETMTVLLDNVLTIKSFDINAAQKYIERFDVFSLIGDVVDNQRQIQKNKCHVSIVSRLKNLEIYSDKTMLRQILNNIIDNSFKYSLDNGEIKITVDKVKNLEEGLDYEIDEIGEFSDKEYYYRTQIYKYVRIRIKDFGFGIVDEQIKQLFIPFRRGENSQGISGLGLGLTIAYTWINLLEGKLYFDSNVGEFTEATIILPIKYSDN